MNMGYIFHSDMVRKIIKLALKLRKRSGKNRAVTVWKSLKHEVKLLEYKD